MTRVTGGNFTERRVPESIRDILTAEAAANDGLAYPFLSVSMYLLVDTVGVVIGKGWLCNAFLFSQMLADTGCLH